MYIQGEGLLEREVFLEKICGLVDENLIIRNNKKISYYNISAAFDIETSSFYDGEKASENKRAIMYIWQFGIGSYVTTGRTWNEFVAFIKVLKKILRLDDSLRLVVYVHNLPYEFQFMRKWLDWEEVFLLEERKPVYANAHGIEFRCSLKLSGGKSLEKVGDDLQKYKIKKAVGKLDYSLIRTPLTKLTVDELLYCENDIRVILCYIQEKIEQDGNITRIPLTNTGYVRNFCRKKCYSRWRNYRDIMDVLTMEPDEYSQLKRAFQGGFTHANAHYSRKLLLDVGSHDLASSYPSVMVLEKFPMSKGIRIEANISEEVFTKLLLTKCCLFDLELWGVMPKLHQDHPISYSKCYKLENYYADNGRIVMAEYLKITITEQDFFVYLEFYDWDKMSVSNLIVYDKQYLPKPFVMSMLELYNNKTRLKGVKGEEINYMISKNMANAGYGMTVTNPVREIIKYYDDKYSKENSDVAISIEKYNKNIRRFLFYPWGVWVTSYARANLFSAIIALGDDYVYSDTDSVKTLNTHKHIDYFNGYNRDILNKIRKSASYHRIALELFSPVNNNGEIKTIGLWDDEGVYSKFKTLGAKRYLTMNENGEYILTLAGANKTKAMEFLMNTGDPFLNFDNGLTIPPSCSGRLTLTYIDFETCGVVIDYLGTPYHYKELSSVHMEQSEYNLSMTEEYIKHIEGLNLSKDGYADISE